MPSPSHMLHQIHKTVPFVIHHSLNRYGNAASALEAVPEVEEDFGGDVARTQANQRSLSKQKMHLNLHRSRGSLQGTESDSHHTAGHHEETKSSIITGKHEDLV